MIDYADLIDELAGLGYEQQANDVREALACVDSELSGSSS